MTNLRIEAKLGSPFLAYDPVHLDSLLTFAHFVDIGEFEAPAKRSELKTFDDMPVAFTDGIPHCSAGFTVGREMSDVWHKKWCSEHESLIDFGNSLGLVNTGRGEFKDYAMPVVAVSAGKVVFFANGDEAEIRRLLGHVVAIGKKRAIGFGMIREWVVERTSKDVSIYMPGGVSRNVPKRFDERPKRVQWMSYMYPYWDRTKFAECSIPKWRFDSIGEFEEYTGEVW